MKTVLLVDDDEPARHALKALLESEGYRVICAANGAEALVHLSIAGMDLLITDWSMPTVDGVELCLEVRAKPVIRALPIIFVSSEAAPDQNGLWDAYFRKPFSLSRFLETARALVGGCVPSARNTDSESTRLVGCREWPSLP